MTDHPIDPALVAVVRVVLDKYLPAYRWDTVAGAYLVSAEAEAQVHEVVAAVLDWLALTEEKGLDVLDCQGCAVAGREVCASCGGTGKDPVRWRLRAALAAVKQEHTALAQRLAEVEQERDRLAEQYSANWQAGWLMPEEAPDA